MWGGFAKLKVEEEITDVKEFKNEGNVGEANQEGNSQSQNRLIALKNNANEGDDLNTKYHLAFVVDGHKIEWRLHFLKCFVHI